MKNVILYGLSGAENMYKVLYYYQIFDTAVTIADIKSIASEIKETNPSIEHVYAISNRYNLKWEYVHSIKNPSIEACAIFKDTLQREGLMII